MALSAAASWGAGDFTGGLATRRSDTFRAVLAIFGVGLVALTLVALALGEAFPSRADLFWGVVSGLAGMVGIGFLFRGFATGRMGIVAPVSAVLSTVLPVVFNAFTVGPPRALQLVGFGIALVGIWLLSQPEWGGRRAAGIGMAVMAGLGFGGFFIALDQVSEHAVFWPLVAGRLAACVVMVAFALATRRPMLVRQAPVRLFVMAGMLDVVGNLFFLLATQTGRLDVTAVLASLYPAVTTILAWLVVREEMARLQVVGVVAAILAIVLITI